MTELRNLLADAVQLGSGDSAPAVVARMFAELDRNGDGITQDEIDLARTIRLAQSRGQRAAGLLRYDLNGDLAISRDEVEQAVRFEMGRRGTASNAVPEERLNREIGRLADRVMQRDADGNGKIEGSEIYVADPQQDGDRRLDQWGDLPQAALRADPDGDGRLTEAEAMVLFAKVLGDAGNIAPLVAQKKLVNQSGTAQPGAGCPAMTVPDGAKLIVLGGYEGEALSSVSVAGQDGETSSATVTIEDGSEPLALVLTSYDAIVWQFAGATQRVAKVYAGSLQTNAGDGKPAVGITGVARDKVTFFGSQRCFNSFGRSDGSDPNLAATVVERLTGRKTDATFGQYAIRVVALPSGTFTPARDKNTSRGSPTIIIGDKKIVIQPDGTTKVEGIATSSTGGLAELTADFNHFNPAGIATIDAAKVVSDTKAEAYEVLPQQAGLLQLVKAGILEITGPGKYRILGKMRYPAGLAGAHSVRFALAKGVPAPSGDPGHSCVVSEETGKPIDGNCP
ncbi:MAG: hypothetical protein HY245_04770 [Rhizobiales bacterium]|nr:hypothetical protein [Hyphomicrobiales bacterium]